MPLYEYQCQDCEATFDALRGMDEADDPITCPKCGSERTHRAISLFAAIGESGVVAGGGDACSSCTPSGSCASCHMRSG